MATFERNDMKFADLLNIAGNDNPVLCADGKLGMLLIFSTEDDSCGVQVPGEELHRFIPVADLAASEGGALMQAGAPAMPTASAQGDIIQMMLAMDWAERGGPFIGAL